MTTKMPDCLGAKRCPKAPNNNGRIWCPCYNPCLDEVIRKEFARRKSPVRILAYLRGFLHDSDFMILIRMGRVATANGFVFGRKKIDSLIQASTVGEDGEAARFEKSEIRRAFGVHGRRGIRAVKTVSRGRTESIESAAERAEGAPTIVTSPERPNARGRTAFPASVLLATTADERTGPI